MLTLLHVGWQLFCVRCLQVVAEHLFHEGKFAVGEAFIKEAGIVQSESLKKPFEAMHQVLKEVILSA